ncbi:MAG: hypothetical protein PHE56_01655 [Bacteroidales bacterium]|nr:hypothetical protein [Bacteroidales bacterium]
MKNIISIMLIASLGMLLVFSGCKEDEYVPEPLQKVTVTGQVLTQLDLTNAGIEKAPNIAKIIFRIDSRDLCAAPIAGYTYQVLQYEVPVVDGEFTVQLPAVKFNNVPVEVTLVEFVAEQTIGVDNKKDMVFSTWTNYDFTITEGEDYHKVFVYDSYDLYEF